MIKWQSPLVVYTAIFSNRDKLRAPSYKTECRYLCFTDNPNITSTSWEIVKMKPPVSARLEARKIKLLPHCFLPPHQISVWQDGSMQACGDLHKLIKGIQSIAAYRHSAKRDLFQILNHCEEKQWDRKHILHRIRKKYTTENYPAEFPTFETGILVRKDTAAVRKFNELWWQELSRGSIRDQASFSYISWKLKLNIMPLTTGTNVTKNPYFHFCSHDPSLSSLSDSRNKQILA